MPYVMVPVPEEHVEEAMAAVLHIIHRGRRVDWDAESVNELFHEVDEATRSLLSIVARATITDKPLTQRDAADRIEITEREITALIRDLNDRAAEASRPPMVQNKAVTQTLPNGRTREARALTMPSELAELVREAERIELANVPHPLSGSAE